MTCSLPLSSLAPLSDTFSSFPYTGTLQKQSQMMGVWQSRRVELDRGSLRYFKDGCREARGVLTQNNVLAVEGELPAHILIHTALPGGEERTYTLRAPGGEDDMREWVRRIELAFQLGASPVNPDPTAPAVGGYGSLFPRKLERRKTAGVIAGAASVAGSAAGIMGAALGGAARVTKSESLVEASKSWATEKFAAAKRATAQVREQLEEQMESALTSCDEGKTETLLDKALANGLVGERSPAVIRRAARRVAGRNLLEATASRDPKRLKGALVAARRLQAVDVPEFAPAIAVYKEVRRLPPGWDVSQMLAERKHGVGRLHARADVSHDVDLRGLVQLMFDETYSTVQTRDRSGQPVPSRYQVVQVQEVQNESQWVDYMVRREDVNAELKAVSHPDFFLLDAATGSALHKAAVAVAMRSKGELQGDPCSFRATVPPGAKPGDMVEVADEFGEVLRFPVPQGRGVGDVVTVARPLAGAWPGPPLETQVNEVILFHGTKPIAADKITSEDFRLDLAGTSAGTLYGRGIYLAESITKADEYSHQDPSTGLYTMLLCRATLGHLLYNADSSPDPRRCEDACFRGQHHSVLGDRKACRGTYREFIVFDEDQVYPNYVVRYRRLP